MRTKEIKLYTFDELSPEAQEKAIGLLCDINIIGSWWDAMYEDAKTIGLKITGFDLDRNKHCNGELLLSANEVAQNIFNQHGDTCNTYKIAEGFMKDWQPLFDEYMEKEGVDLETKLQETEEQFLKDLLNEYASMLQLEYDYLTSDEAIIETIEANEYEFTEDGKLDS